MEQEYFAARSATLHLMLDAGEEEQYLESGNALRSVLQRRPVVVGFVVSTLARKIRDGRAGEASTSSGSLGTPSDTGIRLALEAVFGAYDPCTPHKITPVIDSLGQDRLQALFHPAEKETRSLPWTARLCLLHACLAGECRGGGMWEWLPAAADSTCSSALQAITTGSSNGDAATGKGKGRTQALQVMRPPPEGTHKREGADVTGMFAAGTLTQVCAEVLSATTSTRPPAIRAAHGHDSTGSSGRADGVSPAGKILPGSHVLIQRGSDWLRAFHFKLRALRDALLAFRKDEVREDEVKQVIQAQPTQGPKGAAWEGSAEDVEVDPGVVLRALSNSRCRDAFVLAVKTSLEASLSQTAALGKRERKMGLASGTGPAIKLKGALEACLFGVGVLDEQGLLDLEISNGIHCAVVRSTGIAGGNMRATAPTMLATPTHTRTGCALMEGLVKEGVRIRDVLRTLLDIHHWGGGDTQESRGNRSCSHTSGEPGAGDLKACSRRVAVAGVIGSFLEWLTGDFEVGGAMQDSGTSDWQSDMAVAATAITVVYPSRRFPDRGLAADPAETLRNDLQQFRGGRDDIAHRSQSWWDDRDRRRKLLDRLVFGAALASAPVGAQEIEWVDVLGRVTVAARTASLTLYAAACIEKSVALGGQAPFAMAHKNRLLQAKGVDLWKLLQQTCDLHRELTGEQHMTPVAILTRSAAAAVISSRKTSQSWMISAGLRGAGAVRSVIDMITAAKGAVSAPDILEGMAARDGATGLTLASDFFASIVAATAESNERDGDIEGGRTSVYSETVAWLGDALSTAYSPSNVPASLPGHRSVAAITLAQVLTRRIPFESKPVLLAVVKAADVASGKWRNGNSCLSDNESFAGIEQSGSRNIVASLLEVARSAARSPLLPLPVPLLPPPRVLGGNSESNSNARGPTNDGEQTTAIGVRTQTEKSTPLTTEVLLDAFVRSPVEVRRTIREAVKRRDCNGELRRIQRTLTRGIIALHPGREESLDGRHSIAKALPDEMEALKASACLLLGNLVESGAPGHTESKAAMSCPPHYLLESATPPLLDGGENSAPDGCRQRLTALRLDLLLRSFLGNVEGVPGGSSIPDVFQTAQALAQAMSREALALTIGDTGDISVSNSYRSALSFGHSSGARPLRVIGATLDRHGDPDRDSGEGSASDESLGPPRQELYKRLERAPGAQALVAWASSLIKTARQYVKWLPWQPFAAELRQLLLLDMRESVEGRTGASRQRGAHGPTNAAAATVFVVCELLLAWEGGEEVPGSVFSSTLCSSALHTAIAPVPPDSGPPMWLDVLRCLAEDTGFNMSAWVKDSAHQEPYALAAAVSMWIGGGGAAVDNTRQQTSRAAWVQWYRNKLASAIPAHDAKSGQWLVLRDSGAGVKGQVLVLAGNAWTTRAISPEIWRDWGRSPLQAAWNFPAGWRAEENALDGDSCPPPIVLPPFASWLGVVLRGGPECAGGILEGYLRRMAREVYLSCQFDGASNEMAQQWLGALIEAELAADTSLEKREAAKEGTTISGSLCSSECAAAERRLAVGTFFREELLRFGSEEAPVAPVGGPLTWLWPLEALLAACTKAASTTSGVLAGNRCVGGGLDGADCDDFGIVLNSPPSALARALRAVPNDLLCGSRRFGKGSGQPPPATLRVFASRIVDLVARCLAIPSCRHWSVARRLLIGLGLLYHALAKPHTADGSDGHGSSGVARAGAESAQAAALSAIESLMRTALGCDTGDGIEVSTSESSCKEGNRQSGAATKAGNPLFSSACRALIPLERGGRKVAEDLAKALREAGAWRAAIALFERRNTVQVGLAGSPADMVPQQKRSRTFRRVSTGGLAQPRGTRSSAAEQAVPDIDSSLGNRAVCRASDEYAPPVKSRRLAWTCPGENDGHASFTKKVARVGGDALGTEARTSCPRRVLPIRSTRQSERQDLNC